MSLDSEKQHIDNALEASRNLEGFSTPHNASMYVWAKFMLGTTIPNPNQIINYFNNTQDADGGWGASQGTVHGRYFDSGRILMALYMMGATPVKPLDTFLATGDTWDEIHAWGEDWRDVYHPLQCWILGKWVYPPWKDEFFAAVEAKQTDLLNWTTNESGYQGGHRRTHILYSYMYARRQYPNLNGIVNATLNMQRADGSFPGLSEIQTRPNASWSYDTSIEISLMRQILALYPGFRTQELLDSIDRTRPYIQSLYRTETHPTYGVCGYFSPYWDSIEWSSMLGIMACAGNGLLTCNLDFIMQNIIDKLQPSGIPFWLIAVLELAGIGCLGYYLMKH